ncbi:unnamed protein product [Diatraea saccharalis]|uniref:Uncharacterized protein n=1 Tax=Diatraea saccharalis TaxID=40085 RepID=A0A9N9QY49_9NEOP|nr:unnamed protein product [Diatraea saccharalis]
MDELATHSHKFRVPMSERNGRRGLQRPFEYEFGVSSPSPLLALTHASHVATRPPGCSLKEHELSELNLHKETNSVHSSSRHRSRRPSRGRDLYVTVSELHMIATGRMEITCVSTIPEFRNKEDKFADVRNDTVIVDVIKPSTYLQPTINLTTPESSSSEGSIFLPSIMHIFHCIIILIRVHVA